MDGDWWSGLAEALSGHISVAIFLIFQSLLCPIQLYRAHAKYRTKRVVLCIHDHHVANDDDQLAETKARLPIFLPGRQVILRRGFNVQCADLERWMGMRSSRSCRMNDVLDKNGRKKRIGSALNETGERELSAEAAIRIKAAAAEEEEECKVNWM